MIGLPKMSNAIRWRPKSSRDDLISLAPARQWPFSGRMTVAIGAYLLREERS